MCVKTLLSLLDNPNYELSRFSSEYHAPPHPHTQNRPTDQPTTWSSVLLRKLIVTQLVKKLPIFYGIRRLIIVFTRDRH
jgi:hypothetical protein